MKLFQWVTQDPERTLALTERGERLCYGDIAEATTRFDGALGHDLLFALCRNSPGALLGYLGAMNSRAVPLLLDAAMDASLLRELAERYRPGFCLLPAERAEELRGMFPVGEKCFTLWDMELWRTGWTGPKLHPDLKLLLTTSGSTGSPKLVRISKTNLDSNAASIAAYLELDEGERPITSLPLFYSYGMSVVNSHVLRGAALLLTERTVLDRGFWALAQREGASSMAGVPYTYALMERLRMTELVPDALRTLTQAGGRLPETLHRSLGGWCRRTGRRFYVMYGQTEASPRMAYLPPDFTLEKCGSMGIAIPGGRLSLADENGKTIETPDTVGELIYEGPNVSMGYAQTPEDLCLGDCNRGVLHTGDMARRDTEGFYYIVGRLRRFIKLQGKRISLDELETQLRDRLGIETACYGADQDLRVLAERPGEEGLRALGACLFDTMQLPERLTHIETTDRIPKTAAGKTRYPQVETI